MTTLTPFEIRRKLLNMTTREPQVFGVLTVNIHINTSSVRWQIDSPQARQAYRYPVYSNLQLALGYFNQIAVRNDALAQATAYIMANYQGAIAREPDRVYQERKRSA